MEPRQRIVLAYDPATESVGDVEGFISDDNLKTLDKELAPYPFDGLAQWNSLTSHVDGELLERIVSNHMVDGMTSAIGEEAEKGDKELSRVEPEGGMRFTQFRLKRSWRDGAVGEEVTRYSKDKSWLFAHVVKKDLGDSELARLYIMGLKLTIDPFKLVGELQLTFILLLHLSSYGALTVYKRFLPLFTRSSSLLFSPNVDMGSAVDLAKVYGGLITTLAVQLKALPAGVFETELPEFDLFFLDEIESLRQNLGAAPWSVQLTLQWQELRKAGRTWNWDLGDLETHTAHVNEEEESDEEGEYAPVIVEM